MKVHNDLKELLTDFEREHYRWYSNYSDKRNFEMFTDDYLSVNSLASSEPKPLANNKQFDESCSLCGGTGYLEDGTVCPKL